MPLLLPKINQVMVPSATMEEEDPEEAISLQEDGYSFPDNWPTNQPWFGDWYPSSEYLAPQIQFSAFQ